MVEKRIVKKKKKKGEAEEQPMTKDETEVARYLRWNMPNKSSVMYGDKVQYFIGSKAVDFLLDSKWATGKAKSTVEITDRESACTLLDRFLMLGLISRVYRIRKEKKGKEKEKEKKKGKDEKEKSEKMDQKLADSEGAESPKQSPKPAKQDKMDKDDGKDKKKKKVKVSLEPHHDQVFLDADEADHKPSKSIIEHLQVYTIRNFHSLVTQLKKAYVWIYDPVHPKTFVLGILVVLGVVAVCLFPLWPDSMREYSWYLSVLAAIFVGFIFLLAILRYVVFAILWCITFGKLHFWLLPNLTEDCGFFESFVPAYEYEYHCKKDDKGDNDDSGKTEKAKAVEPDRTGKPSPVEPEDNPNHSDSKLTDKENSESTGSNRDEDENETEAWVKVKKADIEEEQESAAVKC